MNTPLSHSVMARVRKGSHIFTCTPRAHPLMEWAMPASAKVTMQLVPSCESNPWSQVWCCTSCTTMPPKFCGYVKCYNEFEILLILILCLSVVLHHYWVTHYCIKLLCLQSQQRTSTHSGQDAEMQSPRLGHRSTTLAQAASLMGPSVLCTQFKTGVRHQWSVCCYCQLLMLLV